VDSCTIYWLIEFQCTPLEYEPSYIVDQVTYAVPEIDDRGCSLILVTTPPYDNLSALIQDSKSHRQNHVP
jgi:hypothetical protein